MPTIISFEGIDGTGKGTQMDVLACALKERGFRVKTIGFPLYESYFGQYVGSYLTGRDGVRADTVDSKSMALWFALDRFEAFRDRDDSDCDFLLINRFVLSNAVYQSVRECDLGNPDLLDFVLTTEHDHFGIPRPDRILLFDMDLDAAAMNVDRKGFREYVGEGRDIYESIPAIQRRAREQYLAYASRLDNVSVIPCMENGKLKSIDAIGTLVLESIQDLLS